MTRLGTVSLFDCCRGDDEAGFVARRALSASGCQQGRVVFALKG